MNNCGLFQQIVIPLSIILHFMANEPIFTNLQFHINDCDNLVHTAVAGWKQRDVAVIFGVSQSTISKLRLRYRDTHDAKDSPKKWETTYHHRQNGSFNSPGDFEESSHHCAQPTDAPSRTSWQAGVSTCLPVVFPESCPEASPNSWSNN